MFPLPSLGPVMKAGDKHLYPLSAGSATSVDCSFSLTMAHLFKILYPDVQWFWIYSETFSMWASGFCFIPLKSGFLFASAGCLFTWVNQSSRLCYLPEAQQGNCLLALVAPGPLPRAWTSGHWEIQAICILNVGFISVALIGIFLLTFFCLFKSESCWFLSEFYLPQLAQLESFWLQPKTY
jgi:hypothetical protein